MQLSVYAHWETEHTTIPFLSLYLSSLPLANETGEEKKRDVEKTSEKGCLCVHAGMDTKCTWPLCMCVCNRNGCERNVVHVKALAWICKLNDRISANTLPLSVSLANSRTKRHTHAQMHTNTPIYAHFAHIRTHTYKKSQNYAHLLADEYTNILHAIHMLNDSAWSVGPEQQREQAWSRACVGRSGFTHAHVRACTHTNTHTHIHTHTLTHPFTLTNIHTHTDTHA